MMGDKFRLLAQAQLEKIGIEIILSDKVTRFENGTVSLSLPFHLHVLITHTIQAQLQSGKSIPCDFYLPCFPTGGNATFLKSGSADARNYAIVDDTFKVQGYNNVFALGDW